MSNFQEDRYTPPTHFCLHPEYWTSPDSEATEYEITELVASLVRAIQPEFVLETGTYHGHTAYSIGVALRDNGHGRLVTIEKDKTCYEQAAKMLWDNGANANVTYLNMNTMDYIPDQDINFAFFDSWQEGRAEEFLRFHGMGRIKPGAIVSFHDTAPHHQVIQYVEKLEEEGYIKTVTIHSPRGFTVAQVLK